jgi:tetratricopeptide (TPR) repeat protein
MMKGSGKTDAVAILILILATALSYAPVFTGDFIFDDHVLIERNPSIRSLGNIPLFFTSKDARVPREFAGLQDDIYRPLQSISYAVSFFLWGLDPHIFHVENVLIHAVNGILLYLLVLALLKKRVLSFFAALLFLLHPVQVEAVSYLSGRSDCLSLFFFLLSFLAYVRATSGRAKVTPGISSLLFFGCALFSKEMAATLPVIIILYLVFFRWEGRRFPLQEVIRATGGYFVILALFLLARTLSLGRVSQEGLQNGLIILPVMARVFFEYLRLLVFPARLTFCPEIKTGDTHPGPATLLYIACIALYAYLSLKAARRDKPAAFLLIAYAVALLPVSNIVPIKAFMQERFLYFPSVFLLTLFPYGVMRIGERLGGKRAFFRKASLAVLAGAVIACGGISFARNTDWKDEKTLLEAELRLHPDDGRVYFGLSGIYFRDGQYAQAADLLQGALQRDLTPLYKTMAYQELGNISRVTNDTGKALYYYEKAIEITPTYVDALNSLGDLHFKRREFTKARRYFERALGVWPDSALFNANLGTVYKWLGDKEKAMHYWRRSLELDPNQPQIREYISRNQ